MYFSTVNQQDGLIHIGCTPELLDQLRPALGLRSSKADSASPVMAQYEIDGGIAQAASTVVDENGLFGIARLQV